MFVFFLSCLSALILLKPITINAAAFIPASPSAVKSPQVLIINQVRGDECCQPGQFEIFKQQVELTQTEQLPAVFTLRYDALQDPAYREVITAADSGLLTWGVFLEITPDLAQAAAVEYTGQPSNWYEAQHAYTLGYSLEERQRLIDELMQTYHDFFGYYPLVTTSWILDTPTLNYLHDQYQVKFHQLTREQWGTDSYTLYGGPPHYPYFASRHWAFVPGSVVENSVLIVRQTVTDPLWNYGDTQARFTSQPNDYLQDGKDFSYFRALLEQALFQQPQGQRGFALLGLENSMDDQYQEVYQQQLQLVAELAEQSELELPQVDEFYQSFESSRVTVYHGQDLVKEESVEAFWLTGQTYRLRLLRRGQQVMIDDLRLYDPALNDYYADQQAQVKAFWITPFLLDGSRFYTQEKKWMQPEKVGNGLEPLPDVVTQPQAWSLPALASDQTELDIKFQSDNQLLLSYQTTQGIFTIKLSPTRFALSSTASQPPRSSWLLNQQTVYELQTDCDQEFCWYQPRVDPRLFAQAQEQQRQAFLPEQQVGQVDAQTSELYAHNPFAVAGKNPVRLVFIPRDDQGLAVQLETIPEIIIASDQVTLETEPQAVLATSPQFYDFASQEPLETTITFKVGDQLKLTSQIHFAPNCKSHWLSCWRQPRYFWWYGRSWLRHQRQLLEEKWQAWRNY